MQPAWMSAHLFYHDDLNLLLNHCIAPLVSALQANQLLERFFFVRYWQGGPHLRLRILPRTTAAIPVVQQLIEEQVTAFYTAFPSTSDLDADRYGSLVSPLSVIEQGQPIVTPLLPNNSLHYIAYEPEYQRYGGQQAMPSVEAHFHESSQITLMCMATGTQSSRRGQAIAMMFLAMAMSIEEPAKLARTFEQIYRGWISTLGQPTPRYVAGMERQYQQQRPQLRALIAHLAGPARSRTSALSNTILAEWITSIQQLNAQLDELARSGVLHVQSASTHGRALLDQTYPVASIVLSCIHMHNNRLGILLHEETFLWFLLQRICRELADATEVPVVAHV